jgi:hypothetical protein
MVSLYDDEELVLHIVLTRTRASSAQALLVRNGLDLDKEGR